MTFFSDLELKEGFETCHLFQLNLKLECIFQLLSVLMFAMISNQAWQPNVEGQEYCIINNSDAACQLPNTVAVIAFLASIGFLVGEYFFDQMSSVKSRKHFVLADLAFSGKDNSVEITSTSDSHLYNPGFWTAAYILSFLMMIYEWYQSGDPVSGHQ